MKNKKYSIVYSSLTGNTKVLADAIHGALPQDECEYFGVSDIAVKESTDFSVWNCRLWWQ